MSLVKFITGKQRFSAKNVCEILFDKNYSSINFKRAKMVIALITISFFALLYSNISMILNENIIVDFILNTILFMFVYFIISLPYVFLLIKQVHKIVSFWVMKNFNNKDLPLIERAYRNSLKRNIPEEKMLIFLKKEIENI